MDEAEAMEIDEAPTSQDWRTQYLDWMIRGIPPSDHAQARRLARRAKSFVLIDNELIRDIHAGTCGHHAAPRTLVCNAFFSRLLLAHRSR